MSRREPPTTVSALALERPGPFDEPTDAALRLPDPPAPVRRGAMPLVASAIPVVGAAVLWLATGTATMLWFALLGPLIALGSIADAARTARRDRRRAAHDAARARRRALAAIEARHAVERSTLWRRHPDVRRLLASSDTGLDAVWRPASGRGERLVVGTGTGRSAVRIAGGGDDAETADLRRRAAVLDGAPCTVPVAAGLAVIGPEGPARAVVRALVLQLCLALPPDRLRIVDPGGDAPDDPWSWLRGLPHGAGPGDRALAVCEPGQAPPAGADLVVARVAPGDAAPPWCGAVVTMTGIDRGRLVHEDRGQDVRLEAMGVAQAAELARLLRSRAADSSRAGLPSGPVALEELLSAGAPARAGLTAPVGVERARPFVLDLVADGPHAVVAGVTGAGKSELLTTWVTSLCARYSTAQVTFLLADFKGGTAFDALAGLPHVTGVITDLDAGGARRALQSLRAELRRREAEIVRVGARDVDGTDLPRLVVVVDEFAALTASHPELGDLFTDIAARGRALGLHLILGTQRASGAFRESLLANCPLRISLRLTDAADSRLLLGVEDAACLSGAPEDRGTALVRRSADEAPHTIRVALSSPTLIADTAASATGPATRRPWLPALPERVTLAELSRRAPRDGTLLGLADEPERQRQTVMTLDAAERGLCAIGRAGSGRTSLLTAIAAQAPRRVWVPRDPEQAWDLVAGLGDQPNREGVLVVIDDLDALLAQYPADYGQSFAERLERVVHASGGGSQVVLSAQRLTGAVARLADLIPRRVLLAPSSRADLIAAGGAPEDFAGELPPGRAVIDGMLVQLALPPGPVPSAQREVATWDPRGRLTVAVARPGPAQEAIRAAADRAGVAVVGVEDAVARHDAGRAPDPPAVAIGDGEQWQRAWRLWQGLRGAHDLLVDADCATDYRLLTGDRALPPYCLAGRSRAWLTRDGGAPTRVRIA